jgi:isoleucyl-tRNA synthetase
MPVYWSPSSRTALAEAELEYDPDHISLCAYVRYPIVPSSAHNLSLPEDIDATKLGILVWTTTPWTLPANQAVAVNPETLYCLVEVEPFAGYAR